jgi:hypothetical protein
MNRHCKGEQNSEEKRNKLKMRIRERAQEKGGEDG